MKEGNRVNSGGLWVRRECVGWPDTIAHADARSRQGTGREPGVRIGSLQVNSPEAWVIGCVVLFVIVFPMYLVARREAE